MVQLRVFDNQNTHKDYSIYRVPARAFMVKPNDWVVVVKREPENDELVVASIDNEKMVIARYQQGSLELSDSTKIAKWKLIGVIERFPDYFISHPFRVDKYISAVNSFLLLVSLVDFGAIGLLPT